MQGNICKKSKEKDKPVLKNKFSIAKIQIRKNTVKIFGLEKLMDFRVWLIEIYSYLGVKK